MLLDVSLNQLTVLFGYLNYVIFRVWQEDERVEGFTCKMAACTVLIMFCFYCRKSMTRVKIINPAKKSDFIIRDFHSFHEKFHSIAEVKVKLMNELGTLLPETIDFKVGYFFGKQLTKYWLMCQKDLENMNKNLSKLKGTFMLWCEARNQ